MRNLTEKELIRLIQSVFPFLSHDRVFAILVDIPRNQADDNPDWQKRRKIAVQWRNMLMHQLSALKLEKIALFAYERVERNNGNLPDQVTLLDDVVPDSADMLDDVGESYTLQRMLNETHLFLALTEFSATAPLKIAAKKYDFRAATMPGFNERMLPALRLDYREVNRRLQIIKEKLDDAVAARIEFLISNEEHYKLLIDLRFRKATVSGGRFPAMGQVGNLPSGETYIVPYEGEQAPESRSEGIMPVQFGDEVVLYRIEKNRARSVEGQGKAAAQERKHLVEEPAYGNLAELGFGVLRDFGILPINEILLDEKLGLHIAFGRSDHFGGAVGEGHFSSPAAMIHIDRIYIPECQPKIHVPAVVLQYENAPDETILSDGAYTIF
ncbi:hypothetical protein JXO59_10750 [candidate division KSB1 bacterium]|nr:hypothetical protein [candidate division KSB1 bacterium]